MPDFRKLYYMLFNAITDALSVMEQGTDPTAILITAQQNPEETYISKDDSD